MSALNALSTHVGHYLRLWCHANFGGYWLDGPVPRLPAHPLDFKSIELELFAVLDVQNRHQRQNRNKTRFSPDVFFRGRRIPVGEPKRLVDGADGHYGIHQRRFLLELTFIAGIFCLANLPSVTFWTAAGMQLQRWLTTDKRVKGFNYSMAALLLLSTIPMI